MARMPGYFQPFHFLTMFEYVRARGYQHAPFHQYLGKKVSGLKATGKEIPKW